MTKLDSCIKNQNEFSQVVADINRHNLDFQDPEF